MTLLPLVVAAIGGGLLSWATRDAGRAGTAIGILALVLVAILVVAMPVAAAPATLAEEPISLAAYGRLYLVLAAVTGILLALLTAVMPHGRGEGEAVAPNRDTNPGPAFLAFLGAAALALGIVSPVTALMPAAAAGLAGFLAVGRLAAEAGPRGGRTDDVLAEAETRVSSRRLGVELLRVAIGLAVAVTALELLIGLADVVAGEPFGVGAVFLALALATGLRIGVVPLHGHAARLMEGTARTAIPVLALWGPGLFALTALAGLEAAVLPLGLPLTVERGVIAGLAVLTIVAGGLGALVQDDIDHVVAYSILQDMGFVLLAFAAGDASAWGPARAWLLVLPLAKSALLAWALATGRTFGTRSLQELGGWARRAPLLALALAVLTLATIGVPGLASFDARMALLRGAFSDPIRSVVFLASLSSLAIVARLIVVGLARPTPVVRGAPDERLRRPQRDLRRRVGASAGQTLELNRVPAAAFLVVALSLVALGAGAGLFGLRGNASADLPAPLPGAQPTAEPSAPFQPVPTDSPTPTAGPSAS